MAMELKYYSGTESIVNIKQEIINGFKKFDSVQANFMKALK